MKSTEQQTLNIINIISTLCIHHTSKFNANANANANKPVASNIELAYMLTPSLQIATRVEHAKEVSDEPGRQYGVSGTWAANSHLTVVIEYLYGKYKNGFVQDSSGHDINSRRQLGLKLSFEFKI